MTQEVIQVSEVRIILLSSHTTILFRNRIRLFTTSGLNDYAGGRSFRCLQHWRGKKGNNAQNKQLL